MEKMIIELEKVIVEAEDFRDKAWGIIDLNDNLQLVLEMEHGYSTLYIRNKQICDISLTKCYNYPGFCKYNNHKPWYNQPSGGILLLCEDQSSWFKVNEIANKMGYEFVHKV